MATRTIGTEIKLTGEKEFNQQMKAINSGLKTTKSDMAALSSEFDDNGNSMKALTAKQKLLQSSVDQHKTKVDALTKQYKAAAATYGENSAMAQKYKQQLNQATVALNKETAALEKNADAMKEKFLAGLKSVASGSGKVLSGIGKGAVSTASGVAKSVGAIGAASMVGVAAIAAGGVTLLTQMAGWAKEAAEAAKTAAEAGETLTETQQQWLDYSGSLDALDASVAGAKSALAGVLLPMLEDLSTEGAAFLSDFTRDMEAAAGDTEKQGQVMADYISKGAKLIVEKLPEYIAVGKELIGGLLTGLSENIDAGELLDMGLDLVLQLLDGIISAGPDLADAAIFLIEKLMTYLTENGPELISSAIGMVSQIVTGLAQAAPDLIPMAGQLITTLITALVSSAPDLLIAGLELILGIISGITTGLGDIEGAAGAIIEAAKTAFSEKGPEILDLGLEIIRGIWSGITSGTEWLFGKLSTWVDDVVGWIAKKLGIASPSKVMRDRVGVWMARGVGVGWEQEMSIINRQIADSINTSFSIPSFAIGSRYYPGRSYTTAEGKTVNLYVTAKAITEADINMLLDLVNRKLGDNL